MARRLAAWGVTAIVVIAGLFGQARAATWEAGPIDEAKVQAALRQLGVLRPYWLVGKPDGIEVTDGADGYRIVVRVRPAALPADRLVQVSVASAAAMFARLFTRADVAFARLAVEQEFARPDGTVRWDVAIRLDMDGTRATQVDWRLMAADVMAGDLGWEGWLGAFSGLYIHPALTKELGL